LELEQHTPMLHFQHDEDGACLRGSEVKPRLDRFLFDQMENENLSKDEWLIKSSPRPALNYKVRIEAKDVPEKTTTTETAIATVEKGDPLSSQENHKGICGSYFANMVKPEKNDTIEDKKRKIRAAFKDTVFYKKEMTLTIVCLNTELLDYIKQHLEVFFLTHNFGTRQSKGFGSFTLAKIDGEASKSDFETLARVYYNNIKLPVFVLQGDNKHKDGNEALKWIRLVYGFMKSGWNYTYKSPDDYFKGFALRYYYTTTTPYNNDKSFVKHKILTGEYRHGIGLSHIGKERAAGNDYRFIRAMLGISDRVIWEKKGKNLNWSNGKPTITYECDDDDIGRVPSPILFSVTADKIFLLPQTIPDALFGKQFTITSTQKPPHRGQIRTPTKQEFDFPAFLREFAKDFNDKSSPKGGTIGIEKVKNKELKDAKQLTLREL
jgi:hypothetical protein